MWCSMKTPSWNLDVTTVCAQTDEGGTQDYKHMTKERPEEKTWEMTQ